MAEPDEIILIMKASGKLLSTSLMMVFLAATSSSLITSVSADNSSPTSAPPFKIKLTKSDNPLDTTNTATNPGAMRVCGNHICAPFENTAKSLVGIMKQNQTNLVFNETHTGSQEVTPTILSESPKEEQQAITYSAPVVVDDMYAMTQSGILDIHSLGVLANDNVTQGKTLTASLVKDVRNGTLILHPNGGFAYIPDVKFYGDDSFQYSASDGSHASVGTVTITVQRHTPISQNDSYTFDQNSTLVIPAMGILQNDSSSSGQPLHAILVTNVEHGKLMLQQNGSFTYSPNPNFNGVDFFTYNANDGVVSGSTSTVTLQVMPALPTTSNSLLEMSQQEIEDLKNKITSLESRVHQLEMNTQNSSSSNTVIPPGNPNWGGD